MSLRVAALKVVAQGRRRRRRRRRREERKEVEIGLDASIGG
jgi:hypothetical protein